MTNPSDHDMLISGLSAVAQSLTQLGRTRDEFRAEFQDVVKRLTDDPSPELYREVAAHISQDVQPPSMTEGQEQAMRRLGGQPPIDILQHMMNAREWVAELAESSD